MRRCSQVRGPGNQVCEQHSAWQLQARCPCMLLLADPSPPLPRCRRQRLCHPHQHAFNLPPDSHVRAAGGRLGAHTACQPPVNPTSCSGRWRLRTTPRQAPPPTHPTSGGRHPRLPPQPAAGRGPAGGSCTAGVAGGTSCRGGGPPGPCACRPRGPACCSGPGQCLPVPGLQRRHSCTRCTGRRGAAAFQPALQCPAMYRQHPTRISRCSAGGMQQRR